MSTVAPRHDLTRLSYARGARGARAKHFETRPIKFVLAANGGARNVIRTVAHCPPVSADNGPLLPIPLPDTSPRPSVIPTRIGQLTFTRPCVRAIKKID